MSYPVLGRLIRAPQTILSGTTYSRPSNCTMIVVELIAAGGGGGGASGTTAQLAAGGGGGSGGYAKAVYLSPPASCTIAIGTAGTAGSSAAGTGGNGSDTTFSDGVCLITAKGGSGGVGMATGTSVLLTSGGVGGVVATSNAKVITLSFSQIFPNDILIAGNPGEPGVRLSGSLGYSGRGGAGTYGGAPAGQIAASADGITAVGLGCGGAGGISNDATSRAGGAGAGGAIIVWEYT